jgi:hypothetical protein
MRQVGYVIISKSQCAEENNEKTATLYIKRKRKKNHIQYNEKENIIR